LSDIWQACNGLEHIRDLKVNVIRVVESQEQVATTKLVESSEEQHQLESLLEATKPPMPQGAEHYDYLIWTPFRYPPLPFGSRFGRRAEHGIFYGSLDDETALAECAYYRFVFLSGMETPLPGGIPLTTWHSTFEVKFDTGHGVALETAPFIEHTNEISDPTRYDASQSLGSVMRDAGVEALTYLSARLKDGVNAGAFVLHAIKSRRPECLQQWVCTTTAETVAFIRLHGRGEQPMNFPLRQFLMNDVLLVPAC